jgi:hypothetical protein
VPLVESIRSHVPIEEVLGFLQRGCRTKSVSRESTKQAGRETGIPEGAIYFYAGRVFPEKTKEEDKKQIHWAILLYGGGLDADKASGHGFEDHLRKNNPEPMDSGARPFDSGALFTKDPMKQLKLDWRGHTSNKEGRSSAKAYFDDHNITTIEEWRDYFALFIEEFFASPSDYWDGTPKKEIDGAFFTKCDDWRNWAFEIHSKWEVPVNLVGDMFVNDSLSRFLSDRAAGFGVAAPGATVSLAPIVRERCRYRLRPSVEAERRAKEIALS